jgi:hypothetical protein
MSDEPAALYVLSDKGLEEIRRRVTGTCSCCGENVHEFDVPDVLELLDDVDRLRAAAAKLRTEYGARVTYADTLTAEGPIADTLDEALEALAAFDAKGHANVVSRELVQRPVGEWHGVDVAQQPEDGG